MLQMLGSKFKVMVGLRTQTVFILCHRRYLVFVKFRVSSAILTIREESCAIAQCATYMGALKILGTP